MPFTHPLATALFLGIASLLGFIPFSCVSVLAAGAEMKQKASQIDNYKRFLAFPPIIKSVKFEIISNNNFPLPAPENLRPKRFVAEYQTNGFILRPVARFEEVASRPDAGWPERIIIGSTDSSSWALEYPDRLIEFPRTPFHKVARWKDPPMIKERATYRQLETLLNLGFTDIPIGGIKWMGDSFSITNDMGTEIRCELTIKQSLVTGAQVVHKTKNGSFHYELTYKYSDPPIENFLPSEITRLYSPGTNSVLHLNVIIRELELSSDQLPEDAFSTAPFAHLIKQRISVANQRFYNSRGNLIRAFGLSGKEDTRVRAKGRFAVFCLALVISTALIGIWFTKQEKQQRKHIHP